MNMLKSNTKAYLIMAIALAVLVNEFEFSQAAVPVNHILGRIRANKQKGQRGFMARPAPAKRSNEMTLDDTNLSYRYKTAYLQTRPE